MKILLSLLLVAFCTTVLSQAPVQNTTTESTPTDTTEPVTTISTTVPSTITTPATPPTTTPPTTPPATSPTTPPPDTTTSSDTSTSSTTPQPSTVAPTVPTPDKCAWNVTQGDVTCIRAEMKAQFIIVNEDKKSYINLGCNATLLNQDCSSNTTQTLVLSEKNEYTLTMVFEKESDKFSVKNITLEYDLPDGETGFVSNDADKLFNVKVGNSYLCRSDIKVHLGNVTMEISDLHIQAFVEKDANFGSTEECDADDKVSDMVPIIVGVALASLIIIVLIAYLVGRRRSRQRGYQSV